MHYNTYRIEYTCYKKNKSILKKGKFRVKNKKSDLQAKRSFEDCLKRKFPDFGSLVIHTCRVETEVESIFRGFFGKY